MHTKDAIKRALQTKKYVLKNVTFMNCSKNLSKGGITIYSANCYGIMENMKHLTIARLSDSGGLYEIYKDTICSTFSLKPYPSQVSLSDFALESLSTKRFCTTFITDTFNR